MLHRGNCAAGLGGITCCWLRATSSRNRAAPAKGPTWVPLTTKHACTYRSPA